MTTLHGIRVRDSNGDITLDATDRSCFLLERVTFSLAGSGGSQTKTYNYPILALIPVAGWSQLGVVPYPISVSFSSTSTTYSVTLTNSGYYPRGPSAIIVSGG
jgi:hypothetical protein